MIRLKELRLENGLKRCELGRLTGYHPNTIANYENNTRQAPYEALIAFAKFFDVSIDYLLGADDGELRGENYSKSGYVLKKDEKELIDSYRNCSHKGKTRIREFAELWSEITDPENEQTKKPT